MNLEQKLGSLFQASILMIITLLVIAWAFTGAILFKDYLHERENFLTILVDSHHDALVSGNWREFMEAAERDHSKYFSEIRVCWAATNQCSDAQSATYPIWLKKAIRLSVPTESPVIIVEGSVILVRPVLNIALLSLLFLVVIGIIFYLNFLTKKKVVMVTNSIRNLAHSITNDLKVISDFPEELLPIANTIVTAMERLKKANDESVKNSALVGLASQVSHDIRSPLAALEMISFNFVEIPEEKRIVLRNSINRIRDIANHLLSQNKARPLEGVLEDNARVAYDASVEFVATILESVISEKRIQYRNHLGIEIDFLLRKESYGLFFAVDPIPFKNVISNLVDNAVESLKDKKGRINIVQNKGLLQQRESVEIVIEDNGIGIPKEVIPLLGEKGATFGKKDGNGLGLYSATQSVTQWKGTLEIQSDTNVGTSIRILVPLAEAPRWFLKELIIPIGSTLVVVDDDQSIHSIWKGRFHSLKANEYDVSLINISTPNELRKFYGKNFEDLEDVIFLIDYEFVGVEERGIDLIIELGIAKNSVLVTSRFEEVLIRNACEKVGVKVVPKLMTTFLPITITQP